MTASSHHSGALLTCAVVQIYHTEATIYLAEHVATFSWGFYFWVQYFKIEAFKRVTSRVSSTLYCFREKNGAGEAISHLSSHYNLKWPFCPFVGPPHIQEKKNRHASALFSTFRQDSTNERRSWKEIRELLTSRGCPETWVSHICYASAIKCRPDCNGTWSGLCTQLPEERSSTCVFCMSAEKRICMHSNRG